MSDELNPYASPTSASHRLSNGRELRQPAHPTLTRICTFGLLLDLACIPCYALCETLSDGLRRVGASLFFVDSFDAIGAACGIWALFAWPVVAGVVMCYSAFPDRHTKWWLLKTIVAGIMLALWLFGCGLLFFMIATMADDDD